MLKRESGQRGRHTQSGGGGLLTGVFLLALVALADTGGARAETVVTRPGITVDILAEAPDGAAAMVLLFEGFQGLLLPESKGFAHKAYPILLQNGIAAALIDAPTDRTGFRGGLDTDFRESVAHRSDIDRVIGVLKAHFGLPVWILGTSNGSRSAAVYAIHRSRWISGVILASSSTDPPFGKPIELMAGMKDISVPLLAIAHLADQCLGSPPASAAEIARSATGSPAAVAMLFTGGTSTGPAPCGIETHHTFTGIEERVVAAIASFIKQHTEVTTRLTTASPD